MDVNNLKLLSKDVINFNYKFFRSPVEYDLTGIEFNVNKDIMEFAYKLAVWKEPEVIDKPDYPQRTSEEKIFHLFIGSVTECLTYLYFKNMGANIKYYDIERDDNKYNKKLDYDLKLECDNNWMTMSVKAIPTYYDNMMRRFKVVDMRVNGSPCSDDMFYTQYLVFKDTYCEDFGIQDYLSLKSDIDNNALKLRFVCIGGIVNYTHATYEQMRNMYASNGRNIIFTKEFEAPRYISDVKSIIGI